MSPPGDATSVRGRIPTGFELPGGPSKNGNTSIDPPRRQTQASCLAIRGLSVFSGSRAQPSRISPWAVLTRCVLLMTMGSGLHFVVGGLHRGHGRAGPAWGNLGHVPQHIPRDVASPLGESFQVHRLDDLVCGSFNPGERGGNGWGVGRPRLAGALGNVEGGPGSWNPLGSPKL